MYVHKCRCLYMYTAGHMVYRVDSAIIFDRCVACVAYMLYTAAIAIINIDTRHADYRAQSMIDNRQSVGGRRILDSERRATCDTPPALALAPTRGGLDKSTSNKRLLLGKAEPSDVPQKKQRHACTIVRRHAEPGPHATYTHQPAGFRLNRLFLKDTAYGSILE